MKLTSLRVVSLEKYVSRKKFNAHEKDILKVFTEIKNNQNIIKEIISIVCRLILREKMWCKLEAHDMFVHFGYDNTCIGHFKKIHPSEKQGFSCYAVMSTNYMLVFTSAKHDS